MAEIVFFDNKSRNALATRRLSKDGRKFPVSHIALIGDFPPRRCGIATFTCDTRDALLLAKPDIIVDVYAMDDQTGVMEGVQDVLLINDNKLSDYILAAEHINSSGAEMAWIQHEFGIFGGPDGEMVIDLLDRIELPVAVTLHTLLDNPSLNQRRIMDAIIDKASTLIVMAKKGRDILTKCYDVSSKNVVVIPHGIPDFPYVNPDTVKAQLGLQGRDVILTFGLLSPEKGIGDMIEAMPAIIQKRPQALYVVLGATHPHIIAGQGENLRHGLQNRAAELGISDNIVFIDSYVDLDLLTQYLQAADVYVTPYHNPNQITSGTLSYAVGLGKPVVSTGYVHAKELLGDGTGVLVPFRDSDSLATAVTRLLTDDTYRNELAQRAYHVGRSMTWSRYAKTALSVFGDILSEKIEISLAPHVTEKETLVGTSALERMTDDTGMFQHSRFGVADRDHGYCIDDNARALALVSLADDLPAVLRARLSAVYASFVQHAWNPDLGVFRNFMHYGRHWLEDAGSSDSNGRTLMSLAIAATKHDDILIREWANELYRETAPRVQLSHSVRATAFSMLAAIKMEEAGRGLDDNISEIRAGADRLLKCLRASRRKGWNWFESSLAYDNCRLPEALLKAGQVLDDANLIEEGLGTMNWIMLNQISNEGWFRPVGSESFGKHYSFPEPFDQQPLEALAAIEGCMAAVVHEPAQKWLDYGEAAYAWFQGINDLHVAVADTISGECCDGLTPVSINANRGAESILAWQLASRQIVQLRNLMITKDTIAVKA
jgi:glycosyltransferase involved in cell wall biosynthesis